jgi:hypothetical protein
LHVEHGQRVDRLVKVEQRNDSLLCLIVTRSGGEESDNFVAPGAVPARPQ